MRKLTGADRKILENTKAGDLGLFHGHTIVSNTGGTAAISLTREFPGQNIIRAAIEKFGGRI